MRLHLPIVILTTFSPVAVSASVPRLSTAKPATRRIEVDQLPSLAHHKRLIRAGLLKMSPWRQASGH